MSKISSVGDLRSVSAYLGRIGATVRSMRTAVVKIDFGAYWRDLAEIKFEKDGTVRCTNPDFNPTEAEQTFIKAEFIGKSWPSSITISNLSPGKMPKIVKQAKPQNLFEFRDDKNQIVMLHVRVDDPKAYLPFTYWDDGEWRQMEPDGKLPLWGMERLGDNAVVFLHEGAKAARAAAELVEAATAPMKKKLAEFPWGKELCGAAHLGWIGGALSPDRTDFKKLTAKGITRVYIVSDNDEPSKKAVAPIAKHLRCTTLHVQFTEEWPASFDLADEWPKEMFSDLDGERRYIGPSFRSVLQPATWATDLIDLPDGVDRKGNIKTKKVPSLRENFVGEWLYVEESDLFVHSEMPDIRRDQQTLNKRLRAFSDAKDTVDLMLKHYTGNKMRLCYRPDLDGSIVNDGSSTAVNLHIPCQIRAVAGDPEPFFEYMRHMFPNEQERQDVLAWCATLIARPDIHMEYGLLLVSENQGIGKTTLASAILGPLVGELNVGWPREIDIVQSQFNDWMANKRLIVVSEIYSGHSWKAYNSMKSLITDREIQVNQKFQSTYTIENWCHVFASSNSLKALKIEDDDRRWFVPAVTERPWGYEKFKRLRTWLKSGGLGIIRHWAENWEETEKGQFWVLPGHRAPMTNRKSDMINDSFSDAQKEALKIGEAMAEIKRPIAVAYSDLFHAAKGVVIGKSFDSAQELKKAAMRSGIKSFDEQITMSWEGKKNKDRYFLNGALADQLADIDARDAEARREIIRKNRVTVDKVYEAEM